MKKIIFTASSLIFAVSLYVGVNAYTNSNTVNDLLLANIEALADNEASITCNGNSSIGGLCWKSLNLQVGFIYYDCYFSGRQEDTCYGNGIFLN